MNRIPGLSQYVNSDKFLAFLQVTPEAANQIRYSFLAQGEYNCNYDFIHPVTGKHLVLRINCGSQMHLNNQITYEYNALQLLHTSGRTPKVYYVDDSKQILPNGILVMDYLSGFALDYEKDLDSASLCLADIHSLSVPDENSLIVAHNPLQAILKECREMFSVYETSPLADPRKIKWIRKLLQKGEALISTYNCVSPYLCCINTELNNTNFLVDRDNSFTRLIDWEKPLLGDPAQDLGHFLAPTTTFWKTDVILNKTQVTNFVESYIRGVNERYPIHNLHDRVNVYLPITCLRGITWCAMAYVEYQNPQRQLRNESTWIKINQYLSHEFLTQIETDFLS